MLRAAEELARIGNENASFKARVAALAADLDALATELRLTRTAIGDRDAELLAHRAEMTKIHGMLDERTAEIAQWRSAFEDVTHRLDDFQKSLSWRSTAPARAAYRLFKK